MLVVGLTACDGDFRPTICTAVNFNLLDCVPTDRSQSRFDLRTNDPRFLGMACTFDHDYRELKRRGRKVLEGLQ